MGPAGQRPRLPEELTFYYDPLIDYHHRSGPEGGLGPSLYLAPQRPAAARALFRSAAARLGWTSDAPLKEPPGRPRGTIIGWWMAAELGEDDIAARLRAHAEAHHQPRWDEVRGEHTWGYGLDEDHPRGQYNALAAAAELGERLSWWRLFNIPGGNRFSEPTVVGVDFPRVALRQAWWDPVAAELQITLAALRPDGTTSFRVTNLPDPEAWEAMSASGVSTEVAAVGADLHVTTAAEPHTLVVRRGRRA